jgi:DASS family divalent anion:Na+ symporter
VSWESLLNSRGGWTIFIWYGGIIGLADGLAQLKFFDWLAKLLSTYLNFSGYSPVVILGGLLFFSLIVRYLFASMAAYVTTMVPVLFTLGVVAQVPPIPLIFLICFSAGYGSLLTHYGGAAGAVLFAPGYVDQITWWKVGAVIVALSYIVNLGIGLPYWKLIGLW